MWHRRVHDQLSEGMSSASHRQPESCERNTLPSSFCPSPRQGRPHGRVLVITSSNSPIHPLQTHHTLKLTSSGVPQTASSTDKKKRDLHPHEPTTTSPILPHRHASTKHQTEHETMPLHPSASGGDEKRATSETTPKIIPQNSTTRPPNPPRSTSADTDTETTIAP